MYILTFFITLVDKQGRNAVMS